MCEQRDVKGLYKKARAGIIKGKFIIIFNLDFKGILDLMITRILLDYAYLCMLFIYTHR